MKKFVSLICTLCLVMSLGAPAFAAKVTDFTDVKAGAWYYDAVSYVADKALFGGVSGNQFAPNTSMTRGMFVTVVGRYAKAVSATVRTGTIIATDVNLRDKPSTSGVVVATGKKGETFTVADKVSGTTATDLPWFKLTLSNGKTAYIRSDLMTETTAGASTKTDFVDVSEKSYYAPYVKWATDKGLILPSTKTQFAPETAIAREDICYTLYRLLEYLELNPEYIKEEVKFKDASSITGYCREAVTAMQRLGVVNGYTDGNFKPQGGGTRAEVASVLMNFVKVAEKTPDKPTPTSGFDKFISDKKIVPATGLRNGSALVSPTDIAQLTYDCLDAVGGKFYSPYDYDRSYGAGFTNAQVKLQTAGILPAQAGAKSLTMFEVLGLSVNTAIYYDAEIKGSYGDNLTGKMLKEYYSLIYSDYATLAKNKQALVTPANLLTHLNIAETTLVTRDIFAKMFIMLREAALNEVLNLSKYKPTYTIEDIKNKPEMKMLHMLGVFESGKSIYLHPERVLNLAETKTLFGQMLAFSNCFKNANDQYYAASSDMCYAAVKNAYDLEPFTYATNKRTDLVTNDLRTSVYLSQKDGSQYQNINSVPATCAMLYNWYNNRSVKTSAMVRKEVSGLTGEWTSSNAQSWLNSNLISFTLTNGTAANLLTALDKGSAVQIMVGGSGTSSLGMVVVGYKSMGTDIWFEVLNPAEDMLGNTYARSSTYIYYSVLDYMLQSQGDKMLVVK